MSRKVLFICTGNYYRSRFAEIYFNHQAMSKGLNWRASSCGCEVFKYQNEGPISTAVLAELERLSIPLPPMRYPMQVCESILEQADMIIALKEAEHRAALARDFPQYEKNVVYWHVHDLDCATVEQALADIRRLVDELIRDLRSGDKWKFEFSGCS